MTTEQRTSDLEQLQREYRHMEANRKGKCHFWVYGLIPGVLPTPFCPCFVKYPRLTPPPFPSPPLPPFASLLPSLRRRVPPGAKEAAADDREASP